MNVKPDVFSGRFYLLSDDSESLSILNRIKYGPRTRYDMSIAQQLNQRYKFISQ